MGKWEAWDSHEAILLNMMTNKIMVHNIERCLSSPREEILKFIELKEVDRSK